MDYISRACHVAAILRFRIAAAAAGLSVGAEKVTAFGVTAAEELGGGRVSGDEGGDFADVGEVAAGAEVAGGAREPDEAASGV